MGGELTQRERDEVLGRTNVHTFRRRIGFIGATVWRAWQLVKRGDELYDDLYRAMKEMEVVDAVLRNLSYRTTIKCEHRGASGLRDGTDCGDDATHSVTQLGFKGEQDIVWLLCERHLPEMNWLWADLQPLVRYDDEI